jgi:uncharacterized protein (TIRG00374 family)
LGFVLFGYLIHRAGAENLAKQLQHIGWWFIPVLLIGLTWLVCTCLAWRAILDSFGYSLPLPYLLRLKLISESVNVVVPAANIGGEGVRAFLLKKRLPGDVAVSSVILDKTMDNIGKMLFTIAGVMVSLFLISIPMDWMYAVAAGLVLVVGFNILAVAVQTAGIFGKTFPFVSRVPWFGRKIRSRQEQFERLDACLKSAYKQNNGVLFRALLWHLSRRALNVAEMWLIFWLLTGEASPENPLFIMSLTTAASNAFVLIPGKWGALEGIQSVLTEFVGYSAAIGMGIGVTRRIRALVFTAIGLLLLRAGK